MRILFENVNFSSRSGPNGFGLKLARQLTEVGNEIVSQDPDVCLAFIQSLNRFNPTVLRLDGIYFNSAQKWEEMNAPIRQSYEKSQSIVVQSNFNRDLIFNFFGKRENVHVISNGTDFDLISKIEKSKQISRIPREKVWMCASSWRPHKRLQENIRLFQEKAEEDHILLIAGENVDDFIKEIKDDRIKILGNLTWEQMISCLKCTGNFIHLAWLDHCPNVVVDAKACGCTLHISNSGGTPELIGPTDFLYEDCMFDFSPVELYNPPRMTLKSIENNSLKNVDLSIKAVAQRYYDVLRSTK